MKKEIVISALVGLTTGTILGVMATSKKATLLRKKLFQNISNNVIQLGETLKEILSDKTDQIKKDET